MNFDFSEEQKLLQKTARDYLTEHCTLAASARACFESGGTHDDALWKGVAEMGWLGAAVPESYGGAGFGALELALIAQELGRALAPIPFGPSVYLVTEALLVGGQRGAEAALAAAPRVGRRDRRLRAGRARRAARAPTQLATRFESGTLSGAKFPVQDGASADLLLVVAREGSAHGARAGRDVGRAGVTSTPSGSLDPSRPLARVALRRRARRAARRRRRRRDAARAPARPRRRADRLRADRRRRARARADARVHARRATRSGVRWRRSRR